MKKIMLTLMTMIVLVSSIICLSCIFWSIWDDGQHFWFIGKMFVTAIFTGILAYGFANFIEQEL